MPEDEGAPLRPSAGARWRYVAISIVFGIALLYAFARARQSEPPSLAWYVFGGASGCAAMVYGLTLRRRIFFRPDCLVYRRRPRRDILVPYRQVQALTFIRAMPSSWSSNDVLSIRFVSGMGRSLSFEGFASAEAEQAVRRFADKCGLPLMFEELVPVPVSLDG